MRQQLERNSIDSISIILYLTLVFAGWLNIYAAEFDPSDPISIFSFQGSAGKQLIWIGSSLLLAGIISILDHNFFESFAYLIYGILIALLLAILFTGKEVAGSKSWIGVGGFGLQPSEFAKFATAFAIAKYLSNPNSKIEKHATLLVAFIFILIPMALIVLQGDTGTALVFVSFLLPLFREGMSPNILIIGFGTMVVFILTLLVKTTILYIILGVLVILGVGLFARNIKKATLVVIVGVLTALFIRSVDFILSDVLKPHQQRRILSLVNPNTDPLGIGWNVTQSKIAIGSGGFYGKGFLQGTQTKFDFVPEQTTDFIFCTIGEEHGWTGSVLVIAVFLALLLRLVYLADRQKLKFARIYGYCVIGVILFHFTINIAMTIGLFPVVGIPLPFFSYGGSSLWAFTILLFAFLKQDASRMQVLERF